MENNTLSRNTIAFIALANEYCHEIENSISMERCDFIDKVIKILPRIYISVSDVIENDDNIECSYYIDSYLHEESYNSIRENIYQILGKDDVYLEVFEEDMKYSDTPIATTISENLSDLYQEFYNMVISVQNTPEASNDIVLAVKENFKSYWGQTLVNVLRAIHNIKYSENFID